jgi:hypothetical protein
MGLHILLEKVFETKSAVSYRFDISASAFEGSNFGIIEFNYATLTYKITKELEGDTDNVITSRALRAILREWKSGGFPKVTEWAG